MKRFFFFLFSVLPVCSLLISAQDKKLLIEINSLKTNEIIGFSYNKMNQLTYFDEKGVATYREFTFKYDKNSGKLSECIINQDRGEFIASSKFTYNNPDYVAEEIKTSGKKINIKTTEQDKIHIDVNGRLTKTAFDDGKLWEEFEYDSNNNIIKYTQHSALGDNDVISTNIYNNEKSAFLNIDNIPAWFWALHMNNMRWCSDFAGKNNLKESTVVDPRFGTTVTEVTYDYDSEGYPTKQYYNGELVKEFKYKVIK